MSIHPILKDRSNGQCELCGESKSSLTAYIIPPATEESIENQVALCGSCLSALRDQNFENAASWRFLEGSIWSEVPAVQVLSYKILNKLKAEGWAQDALDAVYLDEALIARAEAEDRLIANQVIHKDSFGTILNTGDNVILTQNLNVKGTNYIAPKGTMVRKIKLVADNAEQIEGKINGDTIVILTKYVKKS